jgi:uncharacterized protein (DUF2336 family)
MIVRSYLKWSMGAHSDDRADAVSVLANVYLAGELSLEDSRDARAAMMMALDDTSPKVRRALAEALGGSEYAPRPIITALAHDLPEIACIVLANSPVLSDADLIDAAAIASASAQDAIAARPYVSLALSAVLAEVAGPSALMILLNNVGADVSVSNLSRMIERHGDVAQLREAMLVRTDLPACIRTSLALSATQGLASYVRAMGWMPDARAERVDRECREMATISIATDADDADMMDIVRTVRNAQFLTPQLLLRAVLSGEDRFMAASLGELAGLSYGRAMSIVKSHHFSGLRALCRKAGLPRVLEPAFETALATLHGLRARNEYTLPGRLSTRIIEQVMVVCSTSKAAEIEKLMPVLARYQVEALRDESRARVADLMSAPEPHLTNIDNFDILTLPDFTSDGTDLITSDKLKIEHKKAA